MTNAVTEDEEGYTFEELALMLSMQENIECRIEALLAHCPPPLDNPKRQDNILRVWVPGETKPRHYILGDEIGVFTLIEYEINYWTLNYATNDDFKPFE